MRAAKVDVNQVQIVSALKKAGIAVKSLAAVGQGFPDLIAGFRGVNVLLEIKRPERPGRRTPDQVTFLASWPGLVKVVTSPDEAIRVVVDAAKPREEQETR